MNAAILPERLQQIREFLAMADFADAELHPLAGDASFRRYVRIVQGDDSAMLMDAPPEKENVRSYLKIAQYLFRHGYSAPEILASDPATGLLLLEDLGDDSFTAVLKDGDGRTREEELYGCAIDLLAEWHVKRGEMQGTEKISLPAYDSSLLLQEASLFSDWYLPQAAGKDKAALLRAEYRALWQEILARAPLSTGALVHRDYHADNLMWLPDREGVKRVGLLDFQDGVWGDEAYDLVSLLEDARRDVSPALAHAMLARYVSRTGVDRDRLNEAYAVLGAQRNSKIVGIFVRLAARDNKYGYLPFLPRVWRHLEHDLAHPTLAPLRAWIDRHVPADARGIITVRHNSHDLALTA